MPSSTAPLTFFLAITAMASTAAMVTSMGITPGQAPSFSRLKEARVTPVAASLATMPAFCRPMNAMNRPMPAGIATRTDWGIAWKMVLRRPVTVRTMNSTPSKSTSTRALA